jgi:photosystem II stability/assembly factor-like uncharacterized protein
MARKSAEPRAGRKSTGLPRPGQKAKARAKPNLVLVATRKGAWLYHGDSARSEWRANGPHFLGHIIHHLVLDPRDGKTLLAAATTGHLGPTVFRSTDFGRSWKEAARPPAFPKAPEGQAGRTVKHTFWLTPGHPHETNVWYAGTSPQGLFRSADGGVTWDSFFDLSNDSRYRAWLGSEQDGTPDGPTLHSIIVDPRDPTHLYFAMSSGGMHETRDRGKTWAPIVDGMEVVAGFDAKTSPFMIRIVCGCVPVIPTGFISRIIAAFIGSIDPRNSGNVSATQCRHRSAISDSRWWCIRAMMMSPG